VERPHLFLSFAAADGENNLRMALIKMNYDNA
jgi:hypothetical protein